MDKSTVSGKKISPLRGAREARGLGVRETARAAGMDASHLSKLERGEASASIETLSRLARVLGLKELEKLLRPYARNGKEVATRPNRSK